MRIAALLGICLVVGLAPGAFADAPGDVDGQNLLADFVGATSYLQRAHTGFGDYSIVSEEYWTFGSETDELFLARGNNNLFVGISGNLQRGGHAWAICIGTPDGDPDVTGQTECLAQGVDGPPYTLQAAGRLVTVSGDGTSWEYTEDGTGFPCETDYVITVDAHGGSMYISEYKLFNPDIIPTPAGQWTPDGYIGADENRPHLFAERTYVGTSPLDDHNATIEDGWPAPVDGYAAGFDDTNVDGITDVAAGAMLAATATTGLEIAIPYARLGLTGTEEISIVILMLDGAGGDGNGTVVNQLLPGIGTPGSPCDPPEALGLRIDTSAYTSCIPVNLATLPTFSGTAEGLIDPAEYGGVATESQTCPTPYGDQQLDFGEVRHGGSELDALYMTADADNLYVGIAGNLEENGNRLLVFFDSIEGGVHEMTWDGMGPGGSGLEGDFLPPLDSDVETDVLFDYVMAINLGGDPNAGDVTMWVDMWDLQLESSEYKGAGVVESGDGVLSGGTNPYNMQVALHNMNTDGVLGCDITNIDCWYDSTASVAALAGAVDTGFEMVIPLADLGFEPCVATAGYTVNVWALITSGDGWRSNQTLPSARDITSDEGLQNANAGARDWYDPEEFPPLPDEWYRATAGTQITLPLAGEDCDDNGMIDSCEVALGLADDCNGNMIPDTCDVGVVDRDCNDNGVLDSCEELACPYDLDFSCFVGTGDINLIKANYGSVPPSDAMFDLDGSGFVGTGDINLIKANYGPCISE